MKTNTNFNEKDNETSLTRVDENQKTTTLTEELDQFFKRCEEEGHEANELQGIASQTKEEILKTSIAELESLIRESHEEITANTEETLAIWKSKFKGIIFQLKKMASNDGEKAEVTSTLQYAGIDECIRRVINISLKLRKAIDILQVLILLEKENLIVVLFKELNPALIGDYEDSLFILSDYLVNKVELLFKFLQCSSSESIITLFPIFSLCLKKLSKNFKFSDCIMLVNYLIYYRIEISTCAINSLIESLCKTNNLEQAQKIFNELLTYEPQLTFPEELIPLCKFSKLVTGSGVGIVTYGTFIKFLCRANHLDLALFYYEHLKARNLIKDEVIFNLLIDGCAKKPDLEQVRKIYFDMLDHQVKPTIVTFNTIIDAYIRSRDIVNAWKIYEDLIKNHIKPDNFTFSTLFRGIRHVSHKEYLTKGLVILDQLKQDNESIDIILINVLLDSCISLKEDKHLQELFDKVVTNYFGQVQPDIITYNTYIKGCAQMSLYDKAITAFEHMYQQTSDNSPRPNDVTFNSMIDVCVRSNNMNQVWNIIEKMKEAGIKPDNFTYSTIIKGLNRNSNLNINEDGDNLNHKPLRSESENSNELELAFKLFENVKTFSTPDEILYNCIMDACLRFGKIDKMMELYENMLNENIKPSSITCGIIIKAYGMKGNLSKALQIYEEMKTSGIEVSSITYGCLINACIKTENLPKAFEMYEELKNTGYEMNTVLYTTLIKAYSKTKNLQKVLDIFMTMKKENHCSPNNVTYNSVIDCCIKCGETKIADKLFNEMKFSSIKPDIITFSTLIKGYLRRSEFNQAMQYLEIMGDFKVKPDEVLLNSLLDGCEKAKKYSKAVEIFEYVRGFDVEPSMMSYSIMMKILGKLNNFDYSKLLMDEVKRKHKNVSLIIFTCFMKTCFTANNVQEAMSTYSQLKTFKLIPDSVTYSTMANGLLYAKYDSEKTTSLGCKTLYEIIQESLEKNIILGVNLYVDTVKFLRNMKQFSHAENIKALCAENDIQLFGNDPQWTKKSEKGKARKVNSKPGETNMTYLIDGYKFNTSASLNNENRKEVININKAPDHRDALRPVAKVQGPVQSMISLVNISNNMTTTNIESNNKVTLIVESSQKTPQFFNSKLGNQNEGVMNKSQISKKIGQCYNNFDSFIPASATSNETTTTGKQERKPKKFNRF